jgi:hypothetical protein
MRVQFCRFGWKNPNPMDMSVNFILPPEQPLNLDLNLGGDFEYEFERYKT